MASITHIVGVDPGLVHTGVVSLVFRSDVETVTVEHTLVQGPDAQAVASWIKGTVGWYPKVYIEQYRPRQHLSVDARMLQAEQDLRRAVPNARFLTNMGIKRIIQQQLMEMLDVWSFKTSTHHQDLRSAARIALLGMVKDEVLNDVLAEAVRDHLEGRTWEVTHL